MKMLITITTVIVVEMKNAMTDTIMKAVTMTTMVTKKRKQDRSRRCKYIQSIDMFSIMKSKQILNHKAIVTTKT